jgi:AP-1 complex subunit beta-1
LLDIDFDGSAPASMQKEPAIGATGLEGLAGTPQRVESPAAGVPAVANNLNDLLGVFGDGSSKSQPPTGTDDLMNGFASLDMGASNQPIAAAPQKKNNEDILGLF